MAVGITESLVVVLGAGVGRPLPKRRTATRGRLFYHELCRFSDYRGQCIDTRPLVSHHYFCFWANTLSYQLTRGIEEWLAGGAAQ